MKETPGISRRNFIRSAAALSYLFLPGVGRRLQAVPGQLLDPSDYTGRLCYNENPLGPAPAALAAITETASMAHRYPDWYSSGLEGTIAVFHGVESGMVCAGTGATEIIRLIADAFLHPGDELITATPTYFQMASEAAGNGAATIHVPVDENYTIDLAGIAAAITANTKMISFVNPNNPLATIIPKADLEAFVYSLPEGVIVVVDEAYHHYVQTPDYESCLRYVLEGLPVIVVRTFSKAYGLAGARIGYSLASSELTGMIAATQMFGTVSRMSQAAAQAAFSDTDHLALTVSVNNLAKNILVEGFDTLGLSYIPSESNFIMVDVGTPAVPIRDQLAGLGYQVRVGWGMPNHLRISTGTVAETLGFREALESILTMGVPPPVGIPRQFGLNSVYPNPFNADCKIDFTATETGPAQLVVYNSLGEKIRSLVNLSLEPGIHSVTWDGRNSIGVPASSGIYTLVLVQSELAATRRITLLK